jgi:uncharacterized protein YndB with AHSA1/START domain
MVETTSNVTDTATANEIVISRVFAAPRAMVWGALADPWQVGQWWGPKGFTTTILEMDLRTGGKWRLIMHGPDGTNYPNEMTFTEVIPMERIGLELTGCREGAELIHFQQTMTFTDEEGGTRFTVCIVFATAEDRDRNVREYGSIEGGKQMMERLNVHLHERSAHPLEKLANNLAAAPATHELNITRTFNAPRELVWRAWTDPAMAIQWSGPKQWPAFHMELGKKPTDRWRIGMRGNRPGTDIPTEIWQGGILREFVPPERLVYTFAWENRTSVGLPEDGDLHETVITVRLEEHEGKTTMYFHQAFFATAAERDGHNGGWNSSFERLEELVNSQATAPKEAR